MFPHPAVILRFTYYLTPSDSLGNHMLFVGQWFYIISYNLPLPYGKAYGKALGSESVHPHS